MKAIKIYVLACCVCPFINYKHTEEVNKIPPQIEVDYLCNCGWRDSVKWNDTNVMIKDY